MTTMTTTAPPVQLVQCSIKPPNTKLNPATTTVRIEIKTDGSIPVSHPICLDLQLQQPNINISLNIPINGTTASTTTATMGALQKPAKDVGDFE